MKDAKAFELRIECAWLRLTERQRKVPVTVYLTDRGIITGFDRDASRPGREIGTYTSTVTLQDF